MSATVAAGAQSHCDGANHNLTELERSSGRKPSESGASRFDRRKEEILNAAGAVFNRHGLRDATLALVATEIGLNLKSLRHYFVRKEDLVAAAFMRSIGMHRTLVEDALRVEGVEHRLERFVSSYFRLQQRIRSGEVPELLHFGDLRALTEPQSSVVWPAYVDLFRRVRRMLAGAGAADRTSSNARAHLLISQLHWSVVWLDRYLHEDFERVAGRFTDILLSGIAGSPVDPCEAVIDLPVSSADDETLSRESFLRAATELINEIGYRGASVDRISAHLNVTKGAFYHYNETRDALVMACFERTFKVVREAQDESIKAESGLLSIVSATNGLVRRQMHPHGVLLRTSALTALDLPHRAHMARRMALLTLRFQDMLNDGLADSSVRPCDLRIAAQMVTGLINAAAELTRWAPAVHADDAHRVFVAPLFRGLLDSLPAANG